MVPRASGEHLKRAHPLRRDADSVPRRYAHQTCSPHVHPAWCRIVTRRTAAYGGGQQCGADLRVSGEPTEYLRLTPVDDG
jgi:hypothetical protein